MRASLLLLIIALPAAAGKVEAFPKPYEVFPRLLADPRQADFSAFYHGVNGRSVADLNVGHAWGLARWRSGDDLSILWQSGLEFGVASRLAFAGGGELDATDLTLAIPLEARRGGVSAKLSPFARSVHLGDDHVRRTGRAGFRPASHGLRAQAALEPTDATRFYGGVEYLDLPLSGGPGRWGLQSGGEWTGRELTAVSLLPTRPFAAADLWWRERVKWNADLRLTAGLKGTLKDGRVLRLQAGWFHGHSPFGQLYADPEHYWELGVALEF